MTEAKSQLDMDVIHGLQQIMGEEFQTLLETFQNDSLLRIQTIREAVASGDPEEIRRAAHSFKGSAGNMGAVALCELCRIMEARGHSGSSEGCDQLLASIEAEYNQVQALLDGLTGPGS